jgi:small subunit ribosomal protein S4
MADTKCKKCRSAGMKLFLRGDRCFSQKCAMVRKPYAPGQKRKKRHGAISEYGKELKEKQKLKAWYNLRERQFKKYVTEALSHRQKADDVASLLIKNLESRLDNVIFRLGLAASRDQARQLVSHNHFLVNAKSVNIPSYRLKMNDIIQVKSQSIKKIAFQSLVPKLKKQKLPGWLSFNFENFEGKVISEPSFEEAAPPVEIAAIFEFYSR